MVQNKAVGSSNDRPRTPIAALLQRISSLKALAIEADAANAILGQYMSEVLASNAAALTPQLQRFGWQPGKGFTCTVDLHGLAGALQKYKYERLSELGSGSYGVVYKARNRETGETFAIKKLKYSYDDSGFPDTTLREISTLRELHHENIVQLKDIISTLNSQHVYLVLECLDCDLRCYLDTCMEASDLTRIKSITYQIVKAVYHAHSNMIMHRDLKPQNVLVDKSTGKIKVTDFGLARQYLPPFKAYTEKVVTLYYRAPELLLGCPHYCPAIDMWSVGCIMAELVNFTPLFKAESEIGLLYQIFQVLGTPSREEWADIQHMAHFHAEFPKWKRRDLGTEVPRLANDPEALDLLSLLLMYDPKRRITAKQALTHPWFQGLH